MARHDRLFLAVALIGGVAATPVAVSGQGASFIGTGPISHIAVSVRDVEAIAKNFSDVFDLPIPTINDNNRLAQPDGSEDAVARAATFYLPNFLIEIQQSATDFGPIHDTVEQFGQTVHHISFGVRNDYHAMRDRLVARGGTWRGGTSKTTWSYVDFRDRLGITLEPISIQIFDMLDKNTSKATPGETLGTQPVARVGVVVGNVDEAARAFSDILGVTVPATWAVTEMDYPEGSTADPEAHFKMTSWTHENNVTIQLIEPVGGPSPWSEWLRKQGGNSVHHLTFNVGSRLDAMVRRLQAKGGVLVYGSPGGTSALLDFSDKLGIDIGLIGTSE